MNYTWNINQKGSRLDITTNFLKYQNNSVQDLDMFGAQNDKKPLDLKQKIQQNIPQKIDNYFGGMQYKHIIDSSSEFSIGLKLYYTQNDNNARFYTFQNNVFVNDNGRSNYFIYEEQLSSFFINYSKKWNDKIDLSAGIRLENMLNNGRVIQTGHNFSNHYFNFLPTLTILYNANENNQFSYSFSNQLNRPQFWELNPFRQIVSPNIYVENNPFLQSPILRPLQNYF